MSPSSTPAPANKEWAEAKFDALGKDVEEAKTIALAAKKHPCKQEDTIMEIKGRLTQWDKWWKVTMVSIIGGILAVVAFVWNLNTEATAMKQGVQEVKAEVKEVKEEVKDVTQQQTKLQTSIEQNKDQGNNNKALQRLMKQTIREALDEDRPSRNRRNRASGP